MNKTEKFWDMLSNKYDKRAKLYEQTHIKTVENTKKYLNVNDIVLDYGCATGTIAIEIADNVKKIYGIDISSKMIDAAKRKADECKINNIDFVQSSIYDERFKRETFDVILAFNILHLLKDIQTAIQRIKELLRPGGFLISATGCIGEKTFVNSLSLLLLFLPIKIGIVPYIRFFKISELEEFITKGKFQIVETERLSYSPTNYFIVAKKI